MNNAAIADHLASLAASRANDRSIPARARAIRSARYTAAAVAARAASVELARLDAAGVRAALGCGARIAGVVVAYVAAELSARDAAVAGIVAHVEAGTVPAGEAADVADTLGCYLAEDGARLPAETVARVQTAIAALQPPAPTNDAYELRAERYICSVMAVAMAEADGRADLADLWSAYAEWFYGDGEIQIDAPSLSWRSVSSVANALLERDSERLAALARRGYEASKAGRVPAAPRARGHLAVLDGGIAA